MNTVFSPEFPIRAPWVKDEKTLFLLLVGSSVSNKTERVKLEEKVG